MNFRGKLSKKSVQSRLGQDHAPVKSDYILRKRKLDELYSNGQSAPPGLLKKRRKFSKESLTTATGFVNTSLRLNSFIDDFLTPNDDNKTETPMFDYVDENGQYPDEFMEEELNKATNSFENPNDFQRIQKIVRALRIRECDVEYARRREIEEIDKKNEVLNENLAIKRELNLTQKSLIEKEEALESYESENKVLSERVIHLEKKNGLLTHSQRHENVLQHENNILKQRVNGMQSLLNNVHSELKDTYNNWNNSKLQPSAANKSKRKPLLPFLMLSLCMVLYFMLFTIWPKGMWVLSTWGMKVLILIVLLSVFFAGGRMLLRS